VRYKNKLAAALIAQLLAAPLARAQLLDTLLPPAVPGFGQKFSVIAQRRQFAPGATGWNFGGITATPSVNLGAGYDSAPGGSTGSPVLQGNATMLLTDDAAGFGLFAMAGGNAYPQNTAQNISTAALAAGERLALARQTVVLSGAVVHGAVTGFAFDTSEITAPIPFTLKNLRARDEILSGPFTLTPAFTLSRYDFAGQGVPANRIVPAENLTLSYNPGSPLTAVLRLGATQLVYDSPSQNAGILQLVGGVREQQIGLWSLSLLAGMAHRQPATGTGFTAPVLEMRGDWMPTRLDEISLTASHEIDDPDAITAAPYTRTSIKLAVSHAYLENVTVRMLADLAKAQYIQSSLSEFLATGEIDMQWRASPALAVEAVYRYNTRQANLISAANEHVVTLGMTWTP
jgi:hypothetical protein